MSGHSAEPGGTGRLRPCGPLCRLKPAFQAVGATFALERRAVRGAEHRAVPLKPAQFSRWGLQSGALSRGRARRIGRSGSGTGGRSVVGPDERLDAGQPFPDVGHPFLDAGQPLLDAGQPFLDAGHPFGQVADLLVHFHAEGADLLLHVQELAAQWSAPLGVDGLRSSN